MPAALFAIVIIAVVALVVLPPWTESGTSPRRGRRALLAGGASVLVTELVVAALGVHVG